MVNRAGGEQHRVDRMNELRGETPKRPPQLTLREHDSLLRVAATVGIQRKTPSP